MVGRQYACLWTKPLTQGQPHDLEVEPQRPVLDVVEVVLDALLDRGVAAPAVDLRPAGEAGLHLVAQHVLRDPLLELLDEERPLGRGPTSVMSPRSTFQNCGSSSRLVRRRKRPIGVLRGSSSRAQIGPVALSASSNIERNFHILNDRPSRPMRSCRKKTGPASSAG